MKTKNGIKRLGLPVIPALVIAGGIDSALALELGDIEVQSRLGQPLRASIAYALAPNEELADYCVSLTRAASLPGGVPGLSRAVVSVSKGRITIVGDTPVTEPLLSARLSISCPYTAQITREYTLFVDPSELPAEPRLAAAPQTAPTRAAASEPDRVPRTRAVPTGASVAAGDTYRVVTGDSLSAIAARLENREVSVSQAAAAILAANPDAFIDDNPDRLKAGSVLAIPAVAAMVNVAPPTAAAPAPEPAAAAVPEPAAAPVSEPVAAPAPEPVASTAELTEPVTGSLHVDDTAYLAPAGPTQAPDTTAPAVRTVAGMTIGSDAITSDEVVDDTVIDPTAAEAPADIAPVAPVASQPETGTAAVDSASDPLPAAPARGADGSNAVWWTLGGALVVIGGLFVARRRKTEDDDIVARLAARAPNPTRQLADESIEVQIIDAPQAAETLDFDLSDDSPTSENPALDADLVDGKGLGAAGQHASADFGFAETTDLDLEITEAAARQPEEEETDMIPPPSRETSSILESEVLPEETGYDMSVIMDVTKMPAPEEATERDLMAVRVDDEPTLNEEAYTLSKEVDYRILEQDYEEELTATQALNVEIEEAARELAANLGEDVAIESETLAGNETIALDIGTLADEETTALLAGDDETISALDDTGVNQEVSIDFDVGENTAVNEALTENLDALGDPAIDEAPTEHLDALDDTGINEALTVQLDALEDTGIDGELTISLDANDKTAKLEQASANEEFDDRTVEMDIESGKADSRSG